MLQFFQNEPIEQVRYIAAVILACSFFTLVILQLVPAPYGRYYEANKLFSSLTRIPGRLGWICMESPNLIVPIAIAFLIRSTVLLNPANMLLATMYIFHYIYRTLIFPFIQNLKPHTSVTAACAFFFCSANGYIQAYSLLIIHEYKKDWLLQFNFLAGALLWAAGLSINIYSDHILRCLRKPGETGYKIPRGFFFEYVSCANYMGEIVEWFGFALACWNIAALSFAVFTACNLVPRAMQHHRYYQEKFDNYPTSRRAVIPFIL